MSVDVATVQLATVRSQLDELEARAADLARVVQDYDAELAAIDDREEIARIVRLRMDAAFASNELHRCLVSVTACLAMALRHEREPGLRRAA